MEITVPNDEQLLSLTQQVRLRMVNAVTAEGYIPTDDKGIRALAGVLKDIDTQVLTKQRINNDNQNAKDDREVAAQLARVSEHITRTMGNPFKRQSAGALSKNDNALPDIVVVPGQTDVGPSSTRYRDFMGEHGVQE